MEAVRTTVSGTSAAPRLTISPFAPLIVLVIVMDLMGAPLGLLLDPTGIIEDFVFGLPRETIWRAYRWTVLAALALYVCHHLFGTARNMRAFQHRETRSLPQPIAKRIWWTLIGISWVAIAVFWVQAGFSVPIVKALGLEYLEYAVMRTEIRLAVNQLLFNATLYLVTTPALLLAATIIDRNRALYVLASLGTILAVGAFTLARSPIALTGLLALHYMILSSPRGVRFLLPSVVVFLIILLLNHMVAGNPQGYSTIFQYLGARLTLGEWAALPHFVDIFSSDPYPIRSILPPYLQGFFGGAIDSPARIVMLKLVPGVETSGTAGAANGFFIGDAFAVAGIAGVVIAPLWVALQYYVVSRIFRGFQKTPITTFIYSWLLFKMAIGVLGGFSVFIISSLEFAIVSLVYLFLARAATALPSRQPA